MVRSWPGRLARWLIRGDPRRPAAVITTGCLAAALTMAAALAGPGPAPARLPGHRPPRMCSRPRFP